MFDITGPVVLTDQQALHFNIFSSVTMVTVIYNLYVLFYCTRNHLNFD